MDSSSKIFLIYGPTASGKSEFAIKLAKKVKGEIINADSMQVYKDLNILTARPQKKNFKNIKHHLYGFQKSNSNFSTGEWLELVKKKISEIKLKNKSTSTATSTTRTATTTTITWGSLPLDVSSLETMSTIDMYKSPVDLRLTSQRNREAVECYLEYEVMVDGKYDDADVMQAELQSKGKYAKRMSFLTSTSSSSNASNASNASTINKIRIEEDIREEGEEGGEVLLSEAVVLEGESAQRRGRVQSSSEHPGGEARA